jgi:hypothetical protein
MAPWRREETLFTLAAAVEARSPPRAPTLARR